MHAHDIGWKERVGVTFCNGCCWRVAQRAQVLFWCVMRPRQITQCMHQKNPRVGKIRIRNSGAGSGCANFMGAWKYAFFLQENLCP